jgi:hypothetical protein
VGYEVTRWIECLIAAEKDSKLSKEEIQLKAHQIYIASSPPMTKGIKSFQLANCYELLKDNVKFRFLYRDEKRPGEEDKSSRKRRHLKLKESVMSRTIELVHQISTDINLDKDMVVISSGSAVQPPIQDKSTGISGSESENNRDTSAIYNDILKSFESNNSSVQTYLDLSNNFSTNNSIELNATLVNSNIVTTPKPSSIKSKTPKIKSTIPRVRTKKDKLFPKKALTAFKWFSKQERTLYILLTTQARRW